MWYALNESRRFNPTYNYHFTNQMIFSRAIIMLFPAHIATKKQNFAFEHIFLFSY